jgi:hypothetical protein
MGGKALKPINRFKHPIKAFQSWCALMVGPSETAPHQVNFLQLGLIDERAKSPHSPPVKTVIVLIRRLVDHVKIATNHPRSWVSASKLQEFIQEHHLFLL